MTVKIGRIALIIIMLMSLMSCSSKNKPVSEEKVKEDIITAFKIDDTNVKLTSLTLDSVTINDNHSTANVTIEIEDSDAVSTLKVKVYYTYSKNRWAYVSHLYDFVSAVTKKEPYPSLAKQWVIDASHNAKGFYSVFNQSQFKVNLDMACVDTKADREHGSVLFTFESTYTMLHSEVVGKNYIKGTYHYGQGWLFTLEDWSYVETTQYYGQFFMTFPTKLPNEDRWFKTGEKAVIEVYGDNILTITKDQGPVFTNTLQGNLTKDKVRLDSILTPDINGEATGEILVTYSFKLTFNEAEGGTVMIWLNDNLGHGGEIDPPYWMGKDGDGNYFEVTYWTAGGIA